MFGRKTRSGRHRITTASKTFYADLFIMRILVLLTAALPFFAITDAPSVRGDETDSVTVRRDLTYASVDGKPLKLDLYVPKAASKPPLVVWIHGGGWRAGSKKSPALMEVTKHGYALASIDYRFAQQAIFPAQIHDCKAAVRWLRAHADEYGYDGNWIAVAGSSAGGHLALLLGVSGDTDKLDGEVGEHLDQSSKVQAVIDYFGPSDFVLRGKTQPDRAYSELSGSFDLLGGPVNGRPTPEAEAYASPATYVSANDPPLLIFHGDKDEVVLMDQSQRIEKLYHHTKLDATLVVVDGAGHGGRRFFRGDYFETAVKFLNEHRPKEVQ
ncbi:alpha/beta hydrolase [Fuerstiella marisgermanici]|nr:alpha/beta hydrolase [Fuerstiella marisgermanici]